MTYDIGPNATTLGLLYIFRPLIFTVLGIGLLALGIYLFLRLVAPRLSIDPKFYTLIAAVVLLLAVLSIAR